SMREMFTTIASALLSEPVALVAFMVAFSLVLLGGSVLMFLVKGGTIEVLLAAHQAAGAIEHDPITVDSLRGAAQFTLKRFTDGCARLFRPYLMLGLVLMTVYAVSVGGYLIFVVYGYRVASGRILIVGWTFVAAIAAAGLVAWITVVNLFYLLAQIAMAVEKVGLEKAVRAVTGFIRVEFRELAGLFLLVLA